MDKDDYLQVVFELCGIESVDQNNTWDAVRAHREALLNSEDYPVLDGLESSWQRLDDFYNMDGEQIVDRADDEVQLRHR